MLNPEVKPLWVDSMRLLGFAEDNTIMMTFDAIHPSFEHRIEVAHLKMTEAHARKMIEVLQNNLGDKKSPDE